MFLAELFKKNSHEHISELKALELLRTKARNAHETAKRVPTFIVAKDTHPFILVDPTKSSRSTPYLLDGIVDELSSWRGYSKRMGSILGYTSEEVAQSRGHADGKVYVMLPFDMTHVCIAPETSFYKSFAHAISKMHVDKLDNSGVLEWLKSMKAGAIEFGLQAAEKDPTSVKGFMKQLRDLEGLKGLDAKKKLADSHLGDFDQRRVFEVLDRRSTLEHWLSETLDPDKNGFLRMHAAHHFIPERREVWTEGKALLMDVDAYERLHKRGDIK